MAITVGAIITERVRVLLRDIDVGGVQWRDAELIGWYNEACGEITRIRPEANSVTTTLSLVQGALQTIPTGGSRLLEAICNMPNDVEGRAVLQIDRGRLDAENRSWLTDPQTATAYRYAPSLTDPRSFYVYPPSNGDVDEAKLRVVYGVPPAQLEFANQTQIDTSLAAAFSLPDEYAAVVANYILYRAFAKMTEAPDMENRSRGYFNAFRSQLGESIQSMEQNNAKTRDPAGPGV